MSLNEVFTAVVDFATARLGWAMPVVREIRPVADGFVAIVTQEGVEPSSTPAFVVIDGEVTVTAIPPVEFYDAPVVFNTPV